MVTPKADWNGHPLFIWRLFKFVYSVSFFFTLVDANCRQNCVNFLHRSTHRWESRGEKSPCFPSCPLAAARWNYFVGLCVRQYAPGGPLISPLPLLVAKQCHYTWRMGCSGTQRRLPGKLNTAPVCLPSFGSYRRGLSDFYELLEEGCLYNMIMLLNCIVQKKRGEIR